MFLFATSVGGSCDFSTRAADRLFQPIFQPGTDMTSSISSSARPAPVPPDEIERIAALRAYGVLDTPPEPIFDHLTELGRSVFRTPIALISLVDERRQFFKSARGIDIGECARDISFSAHTILSDDPMVVLDARKDERFRRNPIVTGPPNIRFYAGAPLIDAAGNRLGSYCVISDEPRASFSERDRALLIRFAALTTEALGQCIHHGRIAEAEDALVEANERYRLVTRATSEGIWDWDASTGIIFFSARLQCMLGLPEEDHWGKVGDWLQRVHPGDLAAVRAQLQALAETPKPKFECEYRARHEDGNWRWFHARAIATRSAEGRLCRLTGASADVTARKVRDELTGLHSRTSLLNALDSRLRSSGKRAGKFALLLVDLNQFKRINDSYGHNCGDLLLIDTASRIQLTLRLDPDDIAARVVGDEFAVLLNHVQDESDALAYAARLHEAIQAPSLSGDQEIRLSASIGIAFGENSSNSPDQILHDAETAMHQAKTEAGLQTAVFCQTIRERALEKMSLGAELRNALVEGKVSLYYQPKVLLDTEELVGFEALMRWPHPKRGFVPPAEFISLAEESDLILDIGRWTLREAIRQLSDWRTAGLVSSTTTVAVNLSAKQFGDEHLVENLLRKLHIYGLPASCLELEVTEGILISDVERALRVLCEVKAIGVGLDLDDFGTGYSSLQYLQRFPFDALKVDQSFISSLGQGEAAGTIAHSIIALGNALKLEVIAEGIETPEQAQCLRAMGCDYGQGYLYSRPVPAREMEALLRSRFARKPKGLPAPTESQTFSIPVA